MPGTAHTCWGTALRSTSHTGTAHWGSDGRTSAAARITTLSSGRSREGTADRGEG